MRILQANKYFFKGGGADVVFFQTIAGLRGRGHEIIEFSMQNPKNLSSEFAAYFAPALPEKLVVRHDWRESWKIFRHLFHSAEVERRLSALALATEPEVAHLHNVYHHLSASIFLTLRRLRIPTVLTLHDVFPLCPNHSLLRGETMAEELFKDKLYNCVRYRCIDNRFLPSLAGTLEAYYYRLRDIWNRLDALICPSEFMRNKMLEWGFPEKKLRVLLNPYDLPAVTEPLGTHIVYLGRIHYEKGIKVFLNACLRLRDFPIIIAGTGPDDAYVDSFLRQHNLINVARFGWVEGEKWQKIMKQARVVVSPAIFYENCSMTILEALGQGRLVVASNRGGNPEMIADEKTGFLARPEDADDLSRAIRRAMLLDDARAEVMRSEAKKHLFHYRSEQYFGGLEALYSEITQRN